MSCEVVLMVSWRDFDDLERSRSLAGFLQISTVLADINGRLEGLGAFGGLNPGPDYYRGCHWALWDACFSHD